MFILKCVDKDVVKFSITDDGLYNEKVINEQLLPFGYTDIKSFIDKRNPIQCVLNNKDGSAYEKEMSKFTSTNDAYWVSSDNQTIYEDVNPRSENVISSSVIHVLGKPYKIKHCNPDKEIITVIAARISKMIGLEVYDYAIIRSGFSYILSRELNKDILQSLTVSSNIKDLGYKVEGLKRELIKFLFLDDVDDLVVEYDTYTKEALRYSKVVNLRNSKLRVDNSGLKQIDRYQGIGDALIKFAPIKEFILDINIGDINTDDLNGISSDFRIGFIIKIVSDRLNKLKEGLK